MTRRRAAHSRHVRYVWAVWVLTCVSLTTAGATLAVPDAGAGPATRGAAVAATQQDASCADTQGVTVVVDFQELGGGVHVRCAAWPVATGFDALTRAGIVFQTTTRSPGFLCRIAGLPSNDPCVVPSPATAYWSYWLAARGGQWCYSNLGAGNRQPPPGTVEGWSFSLGKDGSTSPPPRYAVPAAPAGTSPTPLASTDCDTSGAAPPTPGTTGGGAAVDPGAVPSGGAPTVGGDTTTDGQGAPDGGSPSGIDPGTPAMDTPGTSTVGAAGAADPSSTSTTADGVGVTPDPATTDPSDGGARPGRDSAAESEEAGVMDLGSNGTSDDGSPLGVVVAVTLIGTLGAGAVLIGRRARRR